MLKFIVLLIGIVISCVVAPILLWRDIQKGDWIMVSVDVSIIWLWGDWLWRKFRDW